MLTLVYDGVSTERDDGLVIMSSSSEANKMTKDTPRQAKFRSHIEASLQGIRDAVRNVWL